MIGLFETGCAAVAGWALVEIYFSRKTRKEYSRAKAFYEDTAANLNAGKGGVIRYVPVIQVIAPAYGTENMPEPNRKAAMPGDTELCGGCGHMLSPESIAACPGETCFRFNEVLDQQRKINIGYTGNLHKENHSAID